MLSTRFCRAVERECSSPHPPLASSIQSSIRLARPAARPARSPPPHTATTPTQPASPSATSTPLATSPPPASGASQATVPAANAATISACFSAACQTAAVLSPAVPPTTPAVPPLSPSSRPLSSGTSPPSAPPPTTHRPSHPHGASPITSRRPAAFTVARSATASSRRDHSRISVLAPGAASRDGSTPTSNSTRA